MAAERQEAETRSQSLRRALVAKDGTPGAFVGGDLRVRVDRIAGMLTGAQCDDVVRQLQAVAPMGLRVPYLVEWVEDRVDGGGVSEAVQRAQLERQLHARRSHLARLHAEIDDQGTTPYAVDPSLMDEAVLVGREVTDLESQLAELTPPVEAAG